MDNDVFPLVSIITPSFNRQEFVSETLDSVMNQTFPHWENIIVDDGSTDSTMDIVRHYAESDSRIKLIQRSRGPKGACTCRNEGIGHSKGKYVLFLDTDDLLEPFCIEQRINVMEANPELDFAIFPSLMFRHKPNDLNLWWNIDKPISELKRQFHQDAICQGTGVLWRKDSFAQIGQWDEDLMLWQDIDLFFRAYIQNYKYKTFFELPPDLHNRRLESSLSRQDFNSRPKLQSRVIVIKRAISLINEYPTKEDVKEAKYMVAEIVSGLARTKTYREAIDLIEFSSEHGALNMRESHRLKRLVFLYRFKAYKFSFGRKLLDVINSEFIGIESTLGTIPHKMASAVK